MTELSPDHGKNQVQEKSIGIEYLSSLVSSNPCQEQASQQNYNAQPSQKSYGKEDALEKLRQLLMITPKESQQEREIQSLNKRVNQLEQSIPDPHKLLEMLAPIISQKLTFSLRIDVIKAIEKQIETNPEKLEKILLPFLVKLLRHKLLIQK